MSVLTVGDFKKFLEKENIPDEFIIAVPDPTDPTNINLPAKDAHCCSATSARVSGRRFVEIIVE